MKKWLKTILLLFTFALCFTQLSKAETEKRWASLDWTVIETLIALGETPVAMGDVASYQRWVQIPQLPDHIVDLGLRMQPNPEQLFSLTNGNNATPLHFINTGFYQGASHTLGRFGQVDLVNFYQEGDAWHNIVQATQIIADIIGKPEQAEKIHSQVLQKIAQFRPLVAPFSERPVALVQFADSRHLRIYGENSPFGYVLKALGLQNSWTKPVNVWGFENIAITELAKLPPNSRLVAVKPYPANLANDLPHNTLWQTLPLARDPLILPAIWTFGGLPSAERFAEELAHALQKGGEQW